MHWSPGLKRKIIAFLRSLFTLLTLILFGISTAGFLPGIHWQIELICNLRPQFLLLACVVLGFALTFRQRALIGIAFLLAMTNLWAIAPLWFQPAPAQASESSMTLVHFNTNRGKADLKALASGQPDILLLQEVTPELDQNLSKLFPKYEIIHSHPLKNTRGSSLLRRKDSDIRITQSKIIYCPDSSKRPLITATAQLGDRNIHLLSLHLTRPMNKGTSRGHKRELACAAEWSHGIQKSEKEEVLIIGDFNATPWARRYLAFLKQGRLIDSLRGYGPQNTWPTTLPMWLGLPIDHAVYSSGLITTDRSTSVIAGSDHTSIQLQIATRS